MQPEEQIYFECQNEYTESFVKDYNTFILFSSIRGLLSIFVWPIYALIIALACAFDVFYASTALLFITIAAVMAFVRSRQKKPVQKFYKQMLITNNGKEVREKRQFTQLGIHTENLDNGNQQFVSYEHFTGFMESKDMAALITSVNSWYVIDLRTLTGGTRDSFVDFLWQHCPLMKRKKKLHKSTGKVINAMVVAMLVLSFLLAILNLPGLYLKERLGGTIGNHMTYQQIADKLEDVGITGADDKLITYLEEEYGDLKYGNYDSDAEVLLLLSYLGEGNFSDYAGWTPSENGVYWFDLESWDPHCMYAYCLQGITALSDGNLQFTEMDADYSDVNWDTGVGTAKISFTFHDKKHTVSVAVDYDWFDPEFLDALSRIIGSENGKQLYFASDGGQGLFVFYGNAQWSKDFTKLTGIKICTNTADLCY